MATHVGHNWKHDKNDKQRFFDNMTREDIEAKCQKEIFRMGGSCILRDESKELQKGKQATAPDAYINGILTDIRSITESTEYYTNQLKAKNSQLGRWNRQNPNETANTVTLYFHEPSWFSMEKLGKSIERLKYMHKIDPETKEYIDEYIHINFDKVLIVLNGADRIIEYDVAK